MLYIRIELWPHGNKERARLLGEATIANVTRSRIAAGQRGPTFDPRTQGDYEVRLMKSDEYASKPGVWKAGAVFDFPRKRLGPWDLLFRALRAAIGQRNPEA
jgi:hypothetical protein